MCANDMVILSESVYIHFVPLPKTKFNIFRNSGQVPYEEK